MIEKLAAISPGKPFNGKQVLEQAKEMARAEFRGAKKDRILTPEEEAESDKLALAITEFVLKDMGIA